jgi:hypothetical protein
LVTPDDANFFLEIRRETRTLTHSSSVVPKTTGLTLDCFCFRCSEICRYQPLYLLRTGARREKRAVHVNHFVLA